ncbi:MAG: hypothetical protein ACK583_16335 [Cyanobacteriota bacterium]
MPTHTIQRRIQLGVGDLLFHHHHHHHHHQSPSPRARTRPIAPPLQT